MRSDASPRQDPMFKVLFVCLTIEQLSTKNQNIAHYSWPLLTTATEV